MERRAKWKCATVPKSIYKRITIISAVDPPSPFRIYATVRSYAGGGPVMNCNANSNRTVAMPMVDC